MGHYSITEKRYWKISPGVMVISPSENIEVTHEGPKFPDLTMYCKKTTFQIIQHPKINSSKTILFQSTLVNWNEIFFIPTYISICSTKDAYACTDTSLFYLVQMKSTFLRDNEMQNMQFCTTSSFSHFGTFLH